MLTEPFKGLGYLFKGLGLLTHKGIRPFVVVPVLINTILFSLGIWLGMNQFEKWMNHLLPSWLSWLEWLLWPIFAIIIFFGVFYTFTLLANLIAAPFNAIMAERVENKLKGLPIPEFQGYKSLPSIIGRTFKSELSKLFYMFKWLIALLIITLIPGLNVISPIAWALFGAWMLAIEYTDYPMGNHELYFKEELKALKKHRFTAFGFGGGLAVMTAIPVVNFFAMPAGVAGATAFWVDKISKDYR